MRFQSERWKNYIFIFTLNIFPKAFKANLKPFHYCKSADEKQKNLLLQLKNFYFIIIPCRHTYRNIEKNLFSRQCENCLHSALIAANAIYENYLNVRRQWTIAIVFAVINKSKTFFFGSANSENKNNILTWSKQQNSARNYNNK